MILARFETYLDVPALVSLSDALFAKDFIAKQICETCQYNTYFQNQYFVVIILHSAGTSLVPGRRFFSMALRVRDVPDQDGQRQPGQGDRAKAS